MRRKRLNHYADIVCKMFVGWRMADDLETMAELPDGIISIDLLSGHAVHSVFGSIDLNIAKEIQAWRGKQCAKEKIGLSDLASATLNVDVKTDKVATDKKKVIMFVFDCRSSIKTSDSVYESCLSEVHKWHSRVSN